MTDASDSHQKAAAAAQRALELDPTLAETHVALGDILFHHANDVGGAEREFRRAIELNANLVEAHLYYGHLLMEANRLPEALTQARLALQLDPLDALPSQYLGTALVYSRQYADAIAVLQQGLTMHDDSVALRHWLSVAHSMHGDHQTAIAEMKRVYEKAPDPMARMVHGWMYARAGRHTDARAILNEVLDYPPEERILAAHALGGTHLVLGEMNRAIEWLERGVEAGTVTWFDLSASPWFDAARADPRFPALIDRAATREKRTGPGAALR